MGDPIGTKEGGWEIIINGDRGLIVFKFTYLESNVGKVLESVVVP